MKVFRLGHRTPIELGPRQFLAEGGEGKVYVRGQTAYKVYHDPARALPLDKLQALAALADPRILAPKEVLLDEQGRAVGYTTRFLADAWPLGRLFARAFKQREGVTPDHLKHLILRLRTGVETVHAAGLLLVDINELNFLIPKDFSEVFFIDADAWQTPRHPATALLDAVRDWTVPTGAWTPATDWFSMGVVTFQLFTGLHPFKGRYSGPEVGFRERLATDAPDDAFAVTRRRMQAGISVFHPEVQVPPAAEPFTDVPPAWLAWYRGLFAEGRRGPPPADFRAVVATVVVRPVPTAPGGLILDHLDTVTGRLLRLFADALHRVVVTDDGVWLDGQRLPFSPEVSMHCAFSPRERRPVGVDTRGAIPVLTDLMARTPLPFGLAAEAVASQGGQVWLKAGDQVHALVLTEAGGRLHAGTRAVAQVMPHAAQLFPGVVIQRLLGAAYVSLLEVDRTRQIRVPALDGATVLDARFDQGVLMVVVHRGNTCDRLVFRFGADDTFDLTTAVDVAAAVPGFVVRGGLCISLEEDGRLALFPAQPGAAARRHVEDPSLAAQPLLGVDGLGLLMGVGDQVVRARMRPPT